METIEVSEKTELEPQFINLDWVTLTASSDQGRAEIKRFGHRIINDEREAGARIFDWHWNRYEGLCSRYVRVGERDEEAILILISYAAGGYWKLVKGFDVKCSRVDAKLDFWVSEGDDENFVQRCYQAMLPNYPKKKGISFWQESSGGQTLYVGSRSSDQFLRLYDKTAQSGLGEVSRRLFRLELEMKRKVARSFWKQVTAFSDPQQMIIAQIRTKVLRHNLPLIIPEPTILLNATALEARVSDADRTIQWLSKSVAPSIMRLVDAGRLEAVERALGVRLFFS